MTVSSQTNSATFIGNDVATTFPLPFRFFSNSDIFAYFINLSNGSSSPMTLGVDYTLSGAGEPEVDGSAISVLTTTSPLSSLLGIYVERILPQTQQADIVNQGEFFATTHEDVFDRLTMLIQQSIADIDHAIRVPRSDPEPAALPPAISRAGLLFSFDGNGDPACVAPSSGSASDLAVNLANSSDPSKGAALIGYKGRTVADRLADTISIKNFGAKGDGITDDTAAILAARNFMETDLSAGNRRKLVWPAGRYIYTSSPNWAINRLHMQFDGEVWLINNGTGNSLILDGGAAGPGVYGMRITGYPLIYGSASSQNGIYMRAVQRSHLELNCRGAGTAFAGLYQEWCVSNTIYFIMNVNEGGLYSIPARGIFQQQRASAEETSYNTFINPECSGMPVGIYQDSALGNLFVGGAVQGCTNVGLQQTANAWNNKFIGTDFEVNTSGDIECDARESQFIGCDLGKKITFTSAAVNCSMIGGATESIVVNSGAARTLLSDVVYNRFGSGSITDSGTQTRYRDMRNKAAHKVENVARQEIAVTVGASPFTYTNTTGNEIDLVVSGGVISQIVFTRTSGYVINVTSGMFRLSPADALTVTYSSAPAIVAYTR